VSTVDTQAATVGGRLRYVNQLPTIDSWGRFSVGYRQYRVKSGQTVDGRLRYVNQLSAIDSQIALTVDYQQ
jgi:hypothetical protein